MTFASRIASLAATVSQLWPVKQQRLILGIAVRGRPDLLHLAILTSDSAETRQRKHAAVQAILDRERAAKQCGNTQPGPEPEKRSV